MINVKRAGIIIDGQLELSKAMFCHKTKTWELLERQTRNE